MALTLIEIGSHVLAKTFILPANAARVVPKTKGVVTERQDVLKRHKVRFTGDRDAWATSDQIKPDPEFESTEPEAASE